MKQTWDVIVIGAGAAGLFAAATAADRGRSTLLVEKNRKPGVKILMSGGTRCNITQDTTWQGIAEAFGPRQGRFLKFALASLPPQQVVDFFHRCQVPTRVEPQAGGGGKVFPCSNRAIDVRDALVRRAREAGAELLTETAVTAIEPASNGLQVIAGERRFRCQSLVITCGGQSYPGCGTTGDGYGWLQQLGHSLAPPRPALTPIRVVQPWVRELSGVTIPDMALSLKMPDHPQPKQPGCRNHCRGAFLFTHKGCSGPAVLNVSRTVTDPANHYKKHLVCDWLPDCHEDRLRRELNSADARRSGKQLGNLLSQFVPRRLAGSLCEQSRIAFDQPLAELGRRDLSTLVDQVKRCSLSVAGTLGFAKAEVTAGGVCLQEVDTRTLASKQVPGLFLAGEILDVDGPIGGYNFQAAFSTGHVAGSNA